MKLKSFTLFFTLLLFQSCEKHDKKKLSLIYFDASLNAQVKEKIKEKHPYFFSKYQILQKKADETLGFKANSVVNKTRIPASKNKHDYLSYAPYKWPDPTKINGLPWLTRDGIINPISQGYDTDFKRTSEFFKTIEILGWAFYYSDEDKYANKAIELIRIWYIKEDTKVNPNINFGQAVPGAA